MTRIVFWRNGQGFVNGGSINFGFDNVTWSQTLSGVFGNCSHTRTLSKRKQMAWNCDLRMGFTHQDIADRRIVGMKTVTKPKPPPVASEQGCPGSVPNSGSGGADGGKVTTASGV